MKYNFLDGPVKPKKALVITPTVGSQKVFDAIESEDVAQALMAAAESELKKRGLTSIRGPYNPTVNDECGLLVEGFESPAMIMMSYNPKYYLNLYEKVGLQGVRDLFAYYISSQVPIPEKLTRVVERFNKSGKVTIRPIEMKKLKERCTKQ